MFLCCSSMYFDEDGDLAHEFYEETIVTKNGRKKVKLKRIQKNLTPQVRNFLNPTTWLYLYTVVLCFMSLNNDNLFHVLTGNYQAGSPLHPCRFPSCALWSLMMFEKHLRASIMLTPSRGFPYSWKPKPPFKITWSLDMMMMPLCGQAVAMCAEPLHVIRFWPLCS